MKVAALTYGGIYANFKSKDDLAAHASERALTVARERLKVRRPVDDLMAASQTQDASKDEPLHSSFA
jgi:hypothetical protein